MHSTKSGLLLQLNQKQKCCPWSMCQSPGYNPDILHEGNSEAVKTVMGQSAAQYQKAKLQIFPVL